MQEMGSPALASRKGARVLRNRAAAGTLRCVISGKAAVNAERAAVTAEERALASEKIGYCYLQHSGRLHKNMTKTNATARPFPKAGVRGEARFLFNFPSPEGVHAEACGGGN